LRGFGVGLDRAATLAFLLSGEETEAVASIDALGHQSGIAGVPYFIFDRRYALAGAQEPVFIPSIVRCADGHQ
jgi:predicted DsbA family dithiol-disulfide isomerase